MDCAEDGGSVYDEVGVYKSCWGGSKWTCYIKVSEKLIKVYIDALFFVKSCFALKLDPW